MKDTNTRNKEIVTNIHDMCAISGLTMEEALERIGVAKEKRQFYITCEEHVLVSIVVDLSQLLKVPIDMLIRSKPEPRREEGR